MTWWLLAGCDRKDPPPRPDPTGEPTAHTGLPLGPPCEAIPVDRPVRLTGNRGHVAGRYLDLADLGRDGCDELVVTNLSDADRNADRAHLVVRPNRDGRLDERAAMTIRLTAWSQQLGEGATILVPTWDQLVTQALFGDWRYRVSAFDVPNPLGGQVVGSDDAIARIYVPNVLNNVQRMSRCRFGEDRGLCVSLFDADADAGDYAGDTWFVANRLEEDLDLVPENADRHYYGDPLDRAELPHGDGDFDGDGRADLAIGAHNSGRGGGAVAVLVEPPAGAHRIWDVATTTIVGTHAAQLGILVSSGDLDGDGVDELLAGAPTGADDGLYVFRGPFRAGEERVDDEAEWIVRDGGRDAWLGSGAAIGDFDGDGRGDLAVGRPEDYYFGTRPGSVAIWFAPPPGVLDPAEADLVLTSGSPDADAFGISVVSGDFDGDGLGDLAIGAPRDTEDGTRTGSVTVWHGAAIVAERARRR